MYATCLFCHQPLGKNAALELFPVGRRLAYDPAKGRLWVVCRRCERWNLTPLEERWEAIEAAEREFRATRQRVATDNIALARLKEGLELVRIGAPPRLELATWRYGDQFRRRRRNILLWSSLPLTLTAAALGAGTLAPAAIGVAASGQLGLAVLNLAEFWRRRRDTRNRTMFVPDGEGGRVNLTVADARRTRYAPLHEKNSWRIVVEQSQFPLPKIGAAFAQQRRVILEGDDARRALATVLPHVNQEGGSARRVREAVDVIAGASSASQLLEKAARVHTGVAVPNYIGRLPAPMRLAMEMAVHEDDERRAMEGELAALDARWREAEEIAAIADSLLVPAEISERLEALRRGA